MLNFVKIKLYFLLKMLLYLITLYFILLYFIITLNFIGGCLYAF